MPSKPAHRGKKSERLSTSEPLIRQNSEKCNTSQCTYANGFSLCTVLAFFDSLAAKWPLLFIISVVALEAIVSALIIKKIRYTEIDWLTYLQQVRAISGGQRDYSKVSGDTGPLVYPAGHVWIYTLLSWLPDAEMCSSERTCSAQYVFLGLSCATYAVVGLLYRKCQVPLWKMGFFFLSKRTHSLFVLRLFNDCFVAFFGNLFLLFVALKKPLIATAFFSLGVSVKMSLLLFAPGYAMYLLFKERRVSRIFLHALIFFSIQIGLAMPFLQYDAYAYLNCAFDLSRAFLFKWTVNWRFVGEKVFASSLFAKILVGLWAFLVMGCTTTWRYKNRVMSVADPAKSVLFLTTVNLIGIITARTLHYQFYLWYYFTLPLILHNTAFGFFAQLVILGAIEFSWNVFPSTLQSSVVLLAAHVLLLCGCFHSLRQGERRHETTSTRDKRKQV